MAGHLLGVLEPSVALQVNRDTGSPPDVTSDGVRKPAALARFRIAAQALYRFKARPVTSVPSELKALEQELSALEAGGDNVVVQYLLEQVMYLHFVLLAGVSTGGGRHCDSNHPL
jgi:hypothetical protein